MRRLIVCCCVSMIFWNVSFSFARRVISASLFIFIFLFTPFKSIHHICFMLKNIPWNVKTIKTSVEKHCYFINIKRQNNCRIRHNMQKSRHTNLDSGKIRSNSYCSQAGIFWTENAVWYSGGSRFCRFGMRSIGKIRYWNEVRVNSNILIKWYTYRNFNKALFFF